MPRFIFFSKSLQSSVRSVLQYGWAWRLPHWECSRFCLFCWEWPSLPHRIANSSGLHAATLCWPFRTPKCPAGTCRSLRSKSCFVGTTPNGHFQKRLFPVPGGRVRFMFVSWCFMRFLIVWLLIGSFRPLLHKCRLHFCIQRLILRILVQGLWFWF